MTKWKIPLYKVFVDKDDIRAISKVITRGMDWAIGPEIELFEKLLANYVGVDYCLAFNSGTSALHASLLAAEIRNGDKILLPSFTFIATANCALMVGATPKFVDIEEETCGLDPHLVSSNVDRKTRCILPVHYAGLPCKIKEIAEVSKQNKIWLIEDAAESLGARIGKKMTGTFGEMSIFSFAGNKIVTTGEGGAVATNSKSLFDKLKLLRSHGRVDKQNYFSSITKPDYVTIGYNWRMSSITAALAISQLEKIEKLINLRRKNARYLNSRLSKLKNVKVPLEMQGCRHVYQMYSILLPNSDFRNKLMTFLSTKGIMSKVFFDPVHLTTFYKNIGYAKNSKLPVTESISQRTLTLPMYPGLKKEELDYICESVKEFLEQE
ncbi:MAG: DegT/DnrJ/EryC1/StrS family aminotransferase [Thaumarchaeota archaeon]|nr:DegT/DnrJ/EryC1/StrS family aminotransferase [Nitrososphaerota archaeon]